MASNPPPKAKAKVTKKTDAQTTWNRQGGTKATSRLPLWPLDCWLVTSRGRFRWVVPTAENKAAKPCPAKGQAQPTRKRKSTKKTRPMTNEKKKTTWAVENPKRKPGPAMWHLWRTSLLVTHRIHAQTHNTWSPRDTKSIHGGHPELPGNVSTETWGPGDLMLDVANVLCIIQKLKTFKLGPLYQSKTSFVRFQVIDSSPQSKTTPKECLKSLNSPIRN